jgi:streptomycin 6-kinase
VTPPHLRHHEARELIPPAFLSLVQGYPADAALGGPSGPEWVAALPGLLAAVLEAWQLKPSGPSSSGRTAVVVPVRREGEELVLKVVWPHVEARDEALALRHWNGRGAVRLVAADPSRSALLLERLDPGRDLRPVDVDTACGIVGDLLRRLNVPAPPALRRLSELVRDELAALGRAEGALPRRMVERAAGLARELTADPACDSLILHTDLHYENVLGAAPGDGRGPWLAIDPKPLAGHPGFEVQPLLRNRVEELGTGSAFRYLVRRRVEVVSEAAGLDEDEALAWSYVHTAIQARWAAAEGDADGVSFDVALLKALDG